MGVQTLLFGYIEEAWPGARSNGSREHAQLLMDNARLIKTHNEAILSALPAHDAWPPLTRHMFAWAPADSPMINYKNRPIHFAASLKEADWALRDWLDKFEGLLRRLYWENAVVYFRSAYLAEHQVTWHPTHEWQVRLTSGVLEPISQWEFKSSMDQKDSMACVKV
jgi:hypothetical protein